MKGQAQSNRKVVVHPGSRGGEDWCFQVEQHLVAVEGRLRDRERRCLKLTMYRGRCAAHDMFGSGLVNTEKDGRGRFSAVAEPPTNVLTSTTPIM
jgi:hypothetical protein